jgi:hypothetical protein
VRPPVGGLGPQLPVSGFVARLGHPPSVAQAPEHCRAEPAASLAGRVDLFLEGCQGVGLALAAGSLAGALAGALRLKDARASIIGLIGAIGGALLFGFSLSEADHPAWPGWPLGALLAGFAFWVLRGVVAGAAERAGNLESSALIAAAVGASALLLAGLSLVISPVAIIALVALGWLAFGRRRLGQRKYEGLRVLR